LNNKKRFQHIETPSADEKKDPTELNSIARDIELAEQKRLSSHAIRTLPQVKKNENNQLKMKEANERFENAKIKILISIIAIPCIIYVILQLVGVLRTAERGSQIGWFLAIFVGLAVRYGIRN